MGKDLGRVEKVVYFCAGGTCAQKGADHLIRETRALLRTVGQYGRTHTVKTHCAGQCEHAPVLSVQPDNTWYRNMDAEKSERVIREHIMAGAPVNEFVLQPKDAESEDSSGKAIPFEGKVFAEWGWARVAAMPAWEMNLHPLIKDVFVNRFRGLEIKVPSLGDANFTLHQPATLAYDGIQASISTQAGAFSIVIGLFKESHPDYERLWRERITEVLSSKRTRSRKANAQEHWWLPVDRGSGPWRSDSPFPMPLPAPTPGNTSPASTWKGLDPWKPRPCP